MAEDKASRQRQTQRKRETKTERGRQTDRAHIHTHSHTHTHTHTHTFALPANHCSQSTAFGTVDRKPRGTRRDGNTASQAEQQHNVNSAGHTVTDG